MNKSFLKTLESIGLTRVEAEVYLAGLLLGAATIKEISKHTNIERTNVYRVIETLQIKSLISLEYRGLKKKYISADPKILDTLIKNTKRNFEEILPELKEIHEKSGGTGNIKIMQGKAALQNEYSDLLEIMRKSDFYYVISNLDKWYSIDNYFLEAFATKRIEKNLFVKFLVQNGEKAKYQKKYEKNFNQEVRILDKNVELETDTIITPYKVIIVSLNTPETIFVIENKSIIKAHKQYFEIMWNKLQR